MKPKRTKGFYMAMVAIGMAAIGVSVVSTGALQGESQIAIVAFASGFGCSLTALGVIFLFRITKNPQTMKEREINRNDERFIMLRGRAAAVTFSVTMIALSAAVFLMVCLNYLIPCYILMGVMAVHAISYFASLHYFGKRM